MFLNLIYDWVLGGFTEVCSEVYSENLLCAGSGFGDPSYD